MKTATAGTEKKGGGETLRVGMCNLLRNMIGLLPTEAEKINKELKEKHNIDLNLKIDKTFRILDDKWHVAISGTDWTGRFREQVFIIQWMTNTCPSSFHLLERVAQADHDHYLGVMSATPKEIMKELAIFTYGKQVAGVLSR